VNEELGVTTLIVTHDPTVSGHVRRTVQIRDGRTSTEVLRSTRLDEHGAEEHVAEEFAVLDRVGRLQLPHDFVQGLQLRDRGAARPRVRPRGRVARHEGADAAAAPSPRAAPNGRHGRHAAGTSAPDDPAAPAAAHGRPRRTDDDAPCRVREPCVRDPRRGRACRAGVSLEVRPGELLVVTGPSGCRQKTTLLNLARRGLDRPTSGRVLLGDDELSALGEDELAAVRRDRLGYVFQSFGLIPVLSAAENVEVPLRLQRMPPAERDARVAESLELVGLGGHAAQRPYELSGGQQQRVGIARAPRRSPGSSSWPTSRPASSTAARRADRDGPHRRARAFTRQWPRW
jgi:putative ABC transport system ATP-binding protein